ncbi:sigma-70 family RNA polymerase sigma factor [bacterium]|nr:sigma-70 family RNA polymerase sigma factor [bacterium]
MARRMVRVLTPRNFAASETERRIGAKGGIYLLFLANFRNLAASYGVHCIGFLRGENPNCNNSPPRTSTYMSGYRTKYLAKRVFNARDGQAYGELYDLYANRIRRFLFFKLPRKEDAEDLLHETFLRAWEYMTSSMVEDVGALLFRIARNLVADFYRKKTPEALTEALEASLQAGTDIEKATDLRIEGAQVIEVLQGMKEEYKEVLVMRYLSEMEIEEIAAALTKTPNNIRVLLHRAKAALKKILPS